MGIDERLERMTERQVALTLSVRLLAQSMRRLERLSRENAGRFADSDEPVASTPVQGGQVY
jgi:hypothetical protein